MIKNILSVLLLLIVLCFYNSFAQDSISVKSGDELTINQSNIDTLFTSDRKVIPCKIKRITLRAVHYIYLNEQGEEFTNKILSKNIKKISYNSNKKDSIFELERIRTQPGHINVSLGLLFIFPQINAELLFRTNKTYHTFSTGYSSINILLESDYASSTFLPLSYSIFGPIHNSLKHFLGFSAIIFTSRVCGWSKSSPGPFYDLDLFWLTDVSFVPSFTYRYYALNSGFNFNLSASFFGIDRYYGYDYWVPNFDVYLMPFITFSFGYDFNF